MTYRNHPINDYEAVMAPGALLVDVREPAEVAEGTLPGSLNIPVGDLPERLDELDAAVPVVLYCRSGGRSAQAADFLVASGFAEVTNLEGGMLAVDATS